MNHTTPLTTLLTTPFLPTLFHPHYSQSVVSSITLVDSQPLLYHPLLSSTTLFSTLYSGATCDGKRLWGRLLCGRRRQWRARSMVGIHYHHNNINNDHLNDIDDSNLLVVTIVSVVSLLISSHFVLTTFFFSFMELL